MCRFLPLFQYIHYITVTVGTIMTIIVCCLNVISTNLHIYQWKEKEKSFATSLGLYFLSWGTQIRFSNNFFPLPVFFLSYWSGFSTFLRIIFLRIQSRIIPSKNIKRMLVTSQEKLVISWLLEVCELPESLSFIKGSVETVWFTG